MSDTTRRALRLLALLQARTVWTGPELAEQLGVTVRSVRRDIDRLRELGYPVMSGRGHGGGYRLGAGRKLPPLLLEPDEAVAVGVGLRLASSSGITGLDEVAARSLERLEHLAHETLRQRIGTIAKAIEVVGGGGPGVDADVLVTLSHGVHEGVQVRMDYVARDGRATQRRIEPYRVLALGKRWYLFAWDLDREDWRTFRLDRIHAARTSTFGFTPRPTPDIQEHLRRSVTTDPYQHAIRVRFEAPRAEVERLFPPTVGVLAEDGPEACVLTTGADDIQWMAAHLAVIPIGTEVLEPPELVAAMRRMSDRLAATVRRSGGAGDDGGSAAAPEGPPASPEDEVRRS